MAFVGCLLFGIYGLAQLAAAAIGLDAYVGGIWGTVIFVACLYLRFTLPLTIAAFFCAKDVWEWHWALALVFVFPGLLLVIPSIFASIFEIGRDALRSRRSG